MGTMRWVLIGCAVFAAPLHAQHDLHPVLSRTGVRHDLFGIPAAQYGDSAAGVVMQVRPGTSRKAPGLAAIYSLLLPGMGELYAGDFNSGKYFLAAEGVLWLTFAAFEIVGNDLRDDARMFAGAQARLTAPVLDDQLYVDVGNFNSLADYNDKRLRDREISRVYDPAHGYAWQWDSEASRLTFRDQRVRSETMYNNRKFIAAGILINHVASAINAARAAIVQNSALEDALGDLRITGGLTGAPGGTAAIVVRIERGF